MVTHRLDVIQHLRRSGVAVSFVTLVDDLPQLFLIAQEIDFQAVRILSSVHKSQILRNVLVENKSANRGFHQSARIVFRSFDPDLYAGMNTHHMCAVSHDQFVEIGENFTIAPLRIGISVFRTRVRQIITSQDHILCRRCNRRTVLRREDIVYGEHQISGFRLSFH